MNLKLRNFRFFTAVIIFVAIVIQFQNCAVGGDGALQLGSSKSGTTDGATGSTTDGTTGDSTGTPVCTCPNPITVACGQPLTNSCGVVCGTGTNGCTPNCANVNPGCMTGSNTYRYNGGGGGCGSGTNCDANGNLANSDCTDCPCRTCN